MGTLNRKESLHEVQGDFSNGESDETTSERVQKVISQTNL